MITVTIGEKILILRKQLGLSQTQLAQRAGLANSTICDIEKNRLTPSIKTLEKITSVLNIPIANLFMNSNGTEGK